MSTVVGLDLSLRNSGIAVLTDGRPTLLRSVGHGGHNGASHAHRSRRIVSQTRAVMGVVFPPLPMATNGFVAAPTRPDLAVIEDQLEHGPMLPSALDRSALWWGVYSALLARKIPVAVVNPSTLKRFATGKGNAKKHQMLEMVREWCPQATDHDQGDAAWLAGMGAVQLGCYPPFALTPWRLEGLKSVAWPEVVSA